MTPALSAGCLRSCCTVISVSLQTAATQTFSPRSGLYYSCQVLQPSSTAMKMGLLFGFYSLFLPPIQGSSLTGRDRHYSVVTLHLPSTTSHLPSSGPAEAPSESIPCRSAASELFSRPPAWAPSVRHPLEFDLQKEIRRNTKTTLEIQL